MATTAAIVGAVAATVGTVASIQASQDAKKDRAKALIEQRKSQAEQKAQNAAAQASERRKQLREERVKRAMVQQAAINTGVGQSASEMGATGSLGTQLGSNIGFATGMYASAARASDYSQSATDFMSSAQNHMADSSMWGSVASMGVSIFGASGGWDMVKGAGKPPGGGTGTAPNPGYTW